MQAELTQARTMEERAEYQECKTILDTNEDGFIAYIRALKIIRDKDLYREEYASFEAHLASRRKKYTRQRVSQLFQHVELRDALSRQPAVDCLPENERQTSELLALSDPVEQVSINHGLRHTA